MHCLNHSTTNTMDASGSQKLVPVEVAEHDILPRGVGGSTGELLDFVVVAVIDSLCQTACQRKTDTRRRERDKDANAFIRVVFDTLVVKELHFAGISTGDNVIAPGKSVRDVINVKEQRLNEIAELQFS